MGMMIFVIASGLTLVFGLMDVLNFGHGAFIAVGAYLAMTTLLPLAGWMQADSLALNLAALGLAMLVAMVGTGVLGWAFERVIIMPVYGQHLKQILITTGGLIVAEQLIHVILGRRPEADDAADCAARRHHRRRCGDREVPPAGACHRPHRLPGHAAACSTAPSSGC